MGARRSSDIRWIEVPEIDLRIAVMTDALREASTGLRLPVSYNDQIAICGADWISPCEEMVLAVWKAAEIKLSPVGLVQTADDSAKMATIEFAQKHNKIVDEQIRAAGGNPDTSFARSLGKNWIIHPKLATGKGAVNYGWFSKAGVPTQTPGGAHDANHIDYSQLWCDCPARMAEVLSTGQSVDLKSYYLTRWPELRAWIEVYP